MQHSLEHGMAPPAGFLSSLRDTVQRNCHIADARSASDYTMCIYLLKMREYFRWEKGYRFGEQLPREEVGEWLREREDLWDDLAQADFDQIAIEGDRINPFAAQQINRHLLPHRLVYSAGLGVASKPHFFLGELLGQEQRCGFDIFISDKEYARDLTAYPAMTLGKSIFVRRESIRRMIWEKLEEWQWHPREDAMARAIASYGYPDDLTKMLACMLDDVMELAILHEMGEAMAGEILGEAWHELLHRLPRSGLELKLRAVRDHLADAMCTLPALVKQGPEGLMHYYFATFSGMRKEIAPGLAAAYKTWTATGSDRDLQDKVAQSVDHWRRLALDLTGMYRDNDKFCDIAGMENYLNARIF